MNVASLENCKRLYELSGWETENISLGHDDDKGSKYPRIRYDCGYLLRRLQSIGVCVQPNDNNEWLCHGQQDKFADPRAYITTGRKSNTPEDALCLLAQRLFEEGILTTPPKEEDKEV
jgi:hypothetical protein